MSTDTAMRIVELEDELSSKRRAVSFLLNTIEELRQHIEDGETDEALALISIIQERSNDD